MNRILAIALCLLAMTLVARAQDADPLTGEAAPEVSMTSVFVLGDALAGGLGAGMKRLTQEDPRLAVQLRYQEESGLARSELYDWPDAVSKIAASNKVDVAVVMIGSNDVRPIRTGELVHEFGTPGWIAAYSAEVDKLITSLKQSGATVHWVSLPPMASPDYDRAVAIIADLQKARAEAAQVHFIDIRKDLLNADGSYMERGPDDTGSFRKLRDRDGVHFMKVGNNKIARLVLTALDGVVIEQGEAGQPVVGEVAPVAPSEAPVPGTGPIFGQMASAGIVNVIRPASPAKTGNLAAAAGSLDAGLAPDTSAQRLFVKGQAPPSQPGRFDDFSFADLAQP